MFFFFKQKTAYEMRISDVSSDVCSSDLFMAGNLVVIAAQNNIESVAFIFDLAKHEMTFLVSDFATERFVPAETFSVVETVGRPSGQARRQGNIYGSIEERIHVGAHLPAPYRFAMIDREIGTPACSPLV